jgi:hypothetical protein
MFCKLNISNLKPVFLLEKEFAYDIFTDDLQANILALTLWELLSTAEISADNYNTFFSGTRNIHSFKSQRNPNYSIV